ncbi:MAG TPA: hypothetical protein VJP02_01370 [Candidatus Sulfotelmatobacter sp.]|nr:hypothetical protein [Candidatus Sulfotelmatobacter sp.]
MSKVDIHSLLYPGANTKVYAHLLLWFGGSNHMNVGYSSTDAKQIHRQVTDMISRGIDGVIVDWYGPNNSIDQATKLVMTEAEAHPGFTFAIMVDQGAIKWNSCSSCSPQQALISQLQYVEQTYFPSSAYMTMAGRPVVTNFNIDLSYSINWDDVSASLSTQPAFLFQNNSGFTHVLSEGSYSWVMPTTSDYGIGYLKSFYDAGMGLGNEHSVGATYKGFNDTLAAWGSSRIMNQQCGQTWLQTFSEINSLYNSGRQLSALQLVTWNDYEEGTEIESGISNCLSVSASTESNSLRWTVKGQENTVDHYIAFVSIDGKSLMPLGQAYPGVGSLNLCSYSIPDATYAFYVQAVGRPGITNFMSSAVQAKLNCASGSNQSLTLKVNPTTMTVTSGRAGTSTVNVTPQAGSFNSAVALTCSELPTTLKCSFAPASVIPGANTASSVLTITSSAAAAANHREARTFFLADCLFGFGLFGVVIVGNIDRGRAFKLVVAGILSTAIIGSVSCGGSTGAPQSSSIPSSYSVTVSGNTGSIQLSTNVTVIVR